MRASKRLLKRIILPAIFSRGIALSSAKSFTGTTSAVIPSDEVATPAAPSAATTIFCVVPGTCPGYATSSARSSPRLQRGTLTFSRCTSKPRLRSSLATYSTAAAACSDPTGRGPMLSVRCASCSYPYLSSSAAECNRRSASKVDAVHPGVSVCATAGPAEMAPNNTTIKSRTIVEETRGIVVAEYMNHLSPRAENNVHCSLD